MSKNHETIEERAGLFNPTIVTARQAEPAAARAVARLLALYGLPAEDALAEAAQIFFLELAALDDIEADPSALVDDQRLRDPLLASEVVEALLDRGISRESAYAGTAAYFQMKVRALTNFYESVHEYDGSDGDFPLYPDQEGADIPLDPEEFAVLFEENAEAAQRNTNTYAPRSTEE